MAVVTLPRTRRSTRSRHRRFLHWLLVSALLAPLLLVAGLRLYTVVAYRGAIVDPASIEPGRTAIVFGAGVLPDGRPTTVLYDRVATAAELYRLGRVHRILLSGDGRPASTQEPEVMRRTALSLGVPDAALLLDGGGLRTHETCARAREVFGVGGAVLITQRFHLPRALFSCAAAGIDAIGAASDRREYPRGWLASWHLRETAATIVAWWDATTR
jgi:vancomycin permeability regulator SanA